MWNQIRINQRFHENVCMRQSALISNAISNIQKDLLSQPLQLLSGVDILGNASSALGHMSKGVAALSMDKKFIQNRQRQVCHNISLRLIFHVDVEDWPLSACWQICIIWTVWTMYQLLKTHLAQVLRLRQLVVFHLLSILSCRKIFKDNYVTFNGPFYSLR